MIEEEDVTQTISVYPQAINQHIIIPIPHEVSMELPSRGLIMVEASLNGVALVAPLEPDGNKSHLLVIEPTLAKEAGITLEQAAELTFQVMDDWPEPELPSDIDQALKEAAVFETWQTLTVKARWEWLRWIRSTKVEATRQKRIGVAISKLKKGDRRPCCFNSASCTIPEISSSGIVKLT